MANARILVVDDDRLIVTIIESVLKKEGYEVYTARNGKEGLEKAREVKPNLMILDIMMPEMDGYEVCHRLKRDPDTADIAVMVLTGRADIGNAPTSWQSVGHVHDGLRGFDTGAADFMIKPVRTRDLVQRVKALLWAGAP